jgi:P27 family predicted phage terminase small subunit
MSRGRRALPDEVKALKGNPGKRRLALKSATGDVAKADTPRLALAVPDFLSHEREREIFRKVIDEYLQRRIARAPDLTAYARWATYVHRWISSKEQLETQPTYFTSTSRHGEQLRRHPVFKDMLDLERVLQSLEDRLGLNPVARQNIIRGLSAMPAALGGLFGDEQGSEKGKADQPELAPLPEGTSAPVSPLGFLQSAGKPH